MSPDLFHDRLFAYHDGELAPEEALRMEAHLASCTDCSSSLAEWRRAAARVFPPIEPSEDDLFVRRVMARVAREPSGFWASLRERLKGAAPLPRWAAAGAAVLAILLLSLGLPWRDGAPARTEDVEYVADVLEGTPPASDEGYGTAIEEFLL